MKDKMTKGAKTMKLFKAIKLISTILILSFLMACGGGSDSSSTGTLSLGLTDASTNDVKAVYVTINEVRVHLGDEGDIENGNGNWEVVATPNKTYSLLELRNGIIEQLGITELETGHYTQLRLLIGDTPDDDVHPAANYIIDLSDEWRELKIPSGFKTGIKIVHGFDIVEDQPTELVLDFDALKSVVKAGDSEKWILKPTIKVIDMLTAGMVSGTVFEGAEPLGGVTISAQIYSPTPEDIKDQVIIQSSTTTESDGSYLMYLRPGVYNIVLYKDAYLVYCKRIEVEWEKSYDEDFMLETAQDTGTVAGEITNVSDVVNLSFRQSSLCEDNSSYEIIEVTSESMVGSGSYGMRLPTGDYKLVASTDGKDTAENDFTVEKDTETPAVDVAF